MKGEMQLRSDRLAVLIDADNASPSLVEPLFREISRYGTPHVKRIYGDWTRPNLASWKNQLVTSAIQPMQQFAYTTGKNSTDSALIIDAMDLLYSGKLDGFCIVSSDSDYTRLATRIRESGLYVYGFGRKHTPKAFVSACDKFIYTEILSLGEDVLVSSTFTVSKESKVSSNEPNELEVSSPEKQELPKDFLEEAANVTAGEDGWIELGLFGNKLTQLHPEFDPRNYGFRQLRKLVRASELFEIREVPSEKNPSNKIFHIRLKSEQI